MLSKGPGVEKHFCLELQVLGHVGKASWKRGYLRMKVIPGPGGFVLRTGIKQR